MSTGWVVVETASALVALLAALVVIGRFRGSPLVRDVALVQAFVVLAIGNLLPNVLPALIADGGEAPPLRLRLRLVCGVLAGLAFAVAALVGELRLARLRLPPIAVAGLGFASPAVGILLLELLDVSVPSETSVRVLQGGAGVLFALSALGFGAGAAAPAERDRFHSALVLGALLAATSRLAAVVDPAAFDAGLHVDDVLRFGFYAVLLVGAVDEVRSYWRRMAVHDERRRVARDLHDGVAQELALIATEAAHAKWSPRSNGSRRPRRERWASPAAPSPR